VTISYKTAAPGNGQVSQVTDGAGTESYLFDTLGRVTSKTRTIDGVNSYTTGYQYNQASG
jgi:YD repeat-containing protein